MPVDVSPQPGLRERQRQETHALIRRTAIALTTEKGLAAVSVQGICAAAGVSSRTFFNHFRSKDEALVPDLPDFCDDARRAFLAADEPDLVTALGTLLGDHVTRTHARGDEGSDPLVMRSLVEANPELLPRALAVFGALEQRVTELVARRTGRAPGDLRCIVAALAATSALRAVVMSLPAGAEDVDLPRLVAGSFAELRRLLAAADPPGRGKPLQPGAPSTDPFSENRN